MKKTTLTILGGFIAASAGLTAQTAPEAVVEDGVLVINPGMENEVRINPPEGQVDGAGNLVIGGVTIDKPDASVDADGNLVLGDGTVLQVPDMPGVSPDPADGFFTGLFAYEEPLLGWFYSPLLNHFYSQQDGWIFWEDWALVDPANGWFFINTEAGSEEGFFSYSNHFNSWVFFFAGEGGMTPLADAADLQTYWFYVADPPQGGDQWHFMDQYYWPSDEDPDRVKLGLYTNDNGENWVRVR